MGASGLVVLFAGVALALLALLILIFGGRD